MGAFSPGARLLKLGGVTGCVVPAAPERSVFNAVVYGSADGLAASLEELGQAYGAAGIEAWCVWVPEDDREAAAVLERSGHVLDASPAAMIRGLAGFKRPPGSALESWTSQGELGEVAAVNDRSYGYDTDSFKRGLPGGLHGRGRVYVAHRGGAPVASVVTTDHERNCEIDLVATVPEARGRGLAGALLGQALADAAERGCETTTLVATRLGRRVYERLGYRAFGTVEMWERRRRQRPPRLRPAPPARRT
jgi:GNAT superfamily N-acetyltransferase